jgi:hypothetical protein
MRRLLVGLGLISTVAVAVAPAALARPPYMAAFHTKYSITAESNIGKARCGACHVDGSRPPAGWLRFGKDLAVALGKTNANGDEVTAGLTKIENEPIRRGSTETYISRIKADKLPSGD